MSDNFQKDLAYYLLVLNLPSNFTETELRDAYRREAKKWHPDLNKNDVNAEGRLKLINEAYEFLGKVNNFKSKNKNSKSVYKQPYKQEYKNDVDHSEKKFKIFGQEIEMILLYVGLLYIYVRFLT